jgi:hypothetical protein
MKNTVKLILIVSILSSVALAGEIGTGTRLCGEMGTGTRCSVSVTNEKEPISIKDEKGEVSTNIVYEWINNILEEIFN